MTEEKKLYVLAKVVKNPTGGEYYVTLLFSDKEKSFKRIADCTPEIQNLAHRYSLDTVFEGISGYFCYYDCNTKEIIVAPREYTPEWGERKLVMDNFSCDLDDDNYVAWHVIGNFVREITDYGFRDNGKVFMKCGRKAKVEIDFTVDMEAIDELLDEYLYQ